MQCSWLHLLYLLVLMLLLLLVGGQCVQAVTSSSVQIQRQALLVSLRCTGCSNTMKFMLTVTMQQQRQKQQCQLTAVAALAGS
jgi:predicted metal-binding protein